MSQGFTRDIPIDTDGTLSANSDFLVSSQKAVKTYVDNSVSAIQQLNDGDYGDITVSGGGTVMTENIKANRIFNYWNLR